MALPVETQLKYWGAATVIFVGLLWVLGDVLLPFIVGGALAYILDPLADRLERTGLSRVLATVVISLIALLAFLLVTMLIVPMIVEQAIQLFRMAPELFGQLQAFLIGQFPSLGDESSTLSQSLNSVGETIRNRGAEFAQTLFSSALGVINAVVFVVVVPVVAFYLLLDWDNMVARVDALLPRDHTPRLRQIFREIDDTMASFVRGQLTVCGILGVFYAVGLVVAGLQFGLVVGVVAGLISFIPYIGALVGGILAFGLALFQFWDTPGMIAVVAVIFMVGQFLEGNILTPKLVGESVGLHPVWLLLALSVFGSLFGFVGMLVAVPVAASLGVVTRFFLGVYKDSRLYRGLDTHNYDSDADR